MRYSRFAVYFTLPDGPLDRFGAAWLGWNAKTGERPQAPAIDGLPAPAHDITAAPRKYGLHGTVKPPFRLAQGRDADGLLGALRRHCATQAPVTLDGLALTRLGGFLALVPEGDTTALNALAGDTVAALDDFRAPLTDSDLERRRKSGLSPAQEAHLLRWGYPYVMDQFRFHITLSGRLSHDDALAVQAALAPHLDDLLPRPMPVAALTLCGEDASGRFHELHRVPLTG